MELAAGGPLLHALGVPAAVAVAVGPVVPALPAAAAFAAVVDGLVAPRLRLVAAAHAVVVADVVAVVVPGRT